MIIQKAYKVRLYSKKDDEQQLLQISGAVRFVWNYYLNKRKEEYLQSKKNMTYIDCAKDLTHTKKHKEYLWLDSVPVHPLQQSLRDLDKAYQAFFNKKAKFPRFKSRKIDKPAFRIPVGWKLKGEYIQLTKNLSIRFRGTKIEGILKSITVSQDMDGKWYASIISHQEINPIKKTGESVGIDLGLHHLVVTSGEKRYENLKLKKSLRRKMKLIQQSLSRKKGGSNNRREAKLLVAKMHKKISNQRMNHLHQTSHRIASENQAVIVCEDLAVKNMVKNHKLAESISNTSWAEFTKQLEYKQIWSGGEFRKIDRFFPSSKTCSDCGYMIETLPLEIREWICPSCKVKHDSDVNAAKNILAIGLSNNPGVESTKSILSNQVGLLTLRSTKYLLYKGIFT